MRYFEVTEPHYALLKAKNPESAKEIYTEVTKVNEELEMSEVPVEYASVVYSRRRNENHQEVPVCQIVQDLQSRTEMILSVEGIS